MKYFDLHCDTISECRKKNLSLRAAPGLSVSLEKGSRYGTWGQVFAIWLEDELRGENAYRYFSDLAAFFAREMERNSDLASFCRSSGDIRKAEEAPKEIALLSIEGSAALGGRMEHLYDAQQAGVRLITLTWNARCEAGDGCMVPDAGGLTPFGFDLVREMNRLNVVVDVSHLSEKGFWDVARTSQKPFVASHSDSKALCGVKRNLTDDQFRELVQGGGLAGINFYKNFLADDNAVPDDILRHIDHFLRLGGENTIAVGSDFDGCELVQGIHGLEDMADLYGRVAGEFGADIADRIFYSNVRRFFAENLDQ